MIELDCRRLLCPMPVIKVQDKVSELKQGEELLAICTDPGVQNDIPAWCRINGHEVLSIETRDDEYMVLIRVGNND